MIHYVLSYILEKKIIFQLPKRGVYFCFKWLINANFQSQMVNKLIWIFILNKFRTEDENCKTQKYLFFMMEWKLLHPTNTFFMMEWKLLQPQK